MAEDVRLKNQLDAIYTDHPYYGVRRMVVELSNRGHPSGPKRVRRLLREMGLAAVYPKPSLSRPATGHRVYPYLLREVKVVRPDQVWSADITYIRMSSGFLYLVAVIDWYSRYVLDWEMSNSLDASFCLDVLDRCLSLATPDIFNTDQGCQANHI